MAWRAAAAGGAALEVYADDSYALLAPGGAPWLASGPTAVHVGGAWFSTAAPPAQPRSLVYSAGFLAAGGDLRVAAPGALTLAAAQAWCTANASCAGLTYAGGAGAIPPNSSVYFKEAMSAGVTPNAGWSAYVLAPLPLTRLGASPSGDGSGYEIRYSANGSTPFTASFALNSSSGAFVFTQRFPLGAAGVATETPENASSLGEFASSTTPATQFPVFVEAPGSPDAAGLGFVSWAGRFFQALGAGSGGAAAAFTAAAGGAEGGPIVLFAGGSGAAGAALVLSPLDNFKSAMLGRAFVANGSAPGAAGAAAAGVSGYVASLPANFSTSTIALFGAAGVTDVMHAWGAALREHHGGAAKLTDPSSEQLTYWTDK